jgi:N-methylhydantoinase A/oxoprolinase/acetone carboxylase beta subunit
LPPPTITIFPGGHDLYGQEKQPLDLPAILAKVGQIKNEVDAIAVSSYFSPLNPEHENRTYTAISRVCDLPVVLGHQLSTKLGSVERATTAALNASLLAVLKDFVVAVRRTMEHRQIRAPLMVVRGDGTLMSDEFATQTPVETIHSGPAASAIGGRFLSHMDDALVVDIGGTTTDIALIEAGQVSVTEEGAIVADYKTSVEAANLFSIGLGGDSHIALDRENKIIIGPERVVPLAYLADQYPQEVASRLGALSQRSRSNATPEWLEYWFLLRDPPDKNSLKTGHEKALIEFLADGPRPLPLILKHLDLFNKVQIAAGRLLREEVVGKAGLTPTDLLHVDGRYATWDTESASVALDVFCRFLFRESAEVRQQVWSQMTEAIVHAIITFLSGKKLELSTLPQDDDIGRWFFYNSLYAFHPHLETQFRLRQPIIGIGAPASIFLKDVASVLHTDLILPDHHQVANAVGAVAGSVMVSEEIIVYPRVSNNGLEVTGYYVQTKDERQVFEDASDALAHARKFSQERALGAALRSGADHPRVILKEKTDGLDTYRIQARALGNPRLMR